MKRTDIIAGNDYATVPAKHATPNRVRVLSTEKGQAYVRYEGNQTNTVLVQEYLERMTYATLDGVELRTTEGKRIQTGMKVEPWGDPHRIQLSKIDRLWSEYETAKAEKDARIEAGRIRMEAQRGENRALFERTSDRVKAYFDFGYISDYSITESKIGNFTPLQWRQLVALVDTVTERTFEDADA